MEEVQVSISCSNEHTAQTLLHKVNVAAQMAAVINNLVARAVVHDFTKLYDEEAELFEKVLPRLATSTYGSEGYQDLLRELGPALQHHYANNSHHPEFYPNGVRGMNLIDIIEMLCDWYAAVKRHNDGDLLKSLEINIKRFNLSPELADIFYNTIIYMWGDEIAERKHIDNTGFQIGKFYRHTDGTEMAIVGEAFTTLYGRALVAETNVPGKDGLVPVGRGPSFAENWVEITREEWLKNFS